MYDGRRGGPTVSGDGADALLAALRSAHAAALAAGGREPLGLRAVEAAPGRRAYLVAFDGPAFLCLRGDLAVESREAAVREVASASILWERLEALVSPERLHGLASAAGRALAVGAGDAEVTAALGLVGQRALALAEWRGVPGRELAALADVDHAVRLQEELHRSYALFVRASEPMVQAQERLPSELVDALRALEEAAATAGAGARLADQLAEALPGCREAAAEIAAAHLTPLGED